MDGTGMARYVVDAVLLEGRSPRELAGAHGISKSWIYELIARYRAGGYPALESRSRKPRSCTHETPVEVVRGLWRFANSSQLTGTMLGQRRSPTTSLAASTGSRQGRRSGGSSNERD